MPTSVAKFFRGDKRRREMDRKRRWDEKQRRLQHRREMRAKGLDPDLVDENGKPLSKDAVAGGGALQGEETSDDAGVDGEAEDEGTNTDEVEDS